MKGELRNILAALSFFTRLPFWRLATLDKEHYERVVPRWAFAGWVTGGIMAATMAVAMWLHLPTGVSVSMALVSRVLVTGALHEDGFADFCDGFGGGTTRQRILEIMKDSHIGTYGVLGLILYYLLMYNVLVALAAYVNLVLVFLMVDPLCKFVSSNIIRRLPYARSEEGAKNKLVYTKVAGIDNVISAISVLPFFVIWIVAASVPRMLFAYTTINLWLLPILLWAVPAFVAQCLFRYMRERIGGYTGDCCGATFIITEAACYLTLLIACA